MSFEYLEKSYQPMFIFWNGLKKEFFGIHKYNSQNIVHSGNVVCSTTYLLIHFVYKFDLYKMVKLINQKYDNYSLRFFNL